MTCDFPKDNWTKLVDEHGERGASQMVAGALREIAGIIESPGYPRVFSYDVSKGDILQTYKITLSDPWPG